MQTGSPAPVGSRTGHILVVGVIGITLVAVVFLLLGQHPDRVLLSLLVLSTGISLFFLIRCRTWMQASAEALLESESRYGRALSATTDALWEWDLISNETFFSRRWFEMLGYADQEMAMTFETWKELCHPDDFDLAVEKIRATLESAGAVRYRAEFRLRAKDGTWRWILGRGDVVRRDAQGKPLMLVGTHIDISERKQAEENAAREKLFSDEVIDSLPGIFYMYDENSRLVRWNRRHEEVTGYSSQEISGKCNLEFFAEEHREGIREAVQTLFAEGAGYAEAPLLLKDGRQIPYFFTGRPAMVGGHPYFLGVGIDISDRKRAEEERERLQDQLLQAQKMESVGRLAGGVAHDFNNMLSVIIGYAELAQLQIDRNAPVSNYLEQIRSAAERSATLTQQLLAVARKQTIAPRQLDLNVTVEGMLTMLRRLIGEEIELAWLPGAGLWMVTMDPSQIDQLLVNLCVNARDAIGGVGKITIETANISLDETYCATHEGLSPGDHVSLIVSDTGCGMDKKMIDGIFEPFFTTKDLGQGTGLGLAMVYGIIKQNRASVNVSSEPGRGTTFQIFLPRAEGQGETAGIAGIEGLRFSRGETILLVEDERTIMEMARTMLTTLNYNLLVTGGPEEAIRLVGGYDGPIDLLLTDVVMPKMNGRQLQERLLTVRPEMRCLFMSGYTADVIASQGVLDAGLHFIQKPFSMQTLAIRLREVLDRD